MTEAELNEVAAAINEDINGITRARAVIRGIHADLEANQARPFEQDFIYATHYGSAPAEPRTKTVNGIAITTRILHQVGPGLSDINGADLLYEIPNRKFVVIQYKRTDTKGRVNLDAEQLDSLIQNCPASCHPRPRSDMRCGSWYSVLHSGETRTVSACRGREIFGSKASVQIDEFNSGLTQSAFDELFGKCYLGARLSYGDVMGQIDRSIGGNRLLFSVVERPWRQA